MSRGAILTLAAVVIASAVFGYVARGFTDTPVAAAVPGEQLTPVGLLGLAVAAEANDSSRADLLAQVAVDRLVEDPTSVPAFWGSFESYLTKHSSLPAEEKLARLLLLEDALEAACSACRTRDELDRLWPIRERLTASATAARETVFEAVVGEIQRFDTDRATKPLETWLVELAGVCPDWERRLSAASATPLTTAQEKHLTELQQVSSRWYQQITDALKEFRTKVERDATSLGQTESQPVADGADGTLQKQLSKLEQLAQAVELAQLDGWQDYLHQLSAQPMDDEALQDIALLAPFAEIADKCAALQRLRYNLWAVNQLATAETSSAWQDYLGAIDVSLLEPATAALYTLAYDKRIRELSEPSAQGEAVRRILRRPKQPLRNF